MHTLSVLPISRRDLLRCAGLGAGALAFDTLQFSQQAAGANVGYDSKHPLIPRTGHFPGVRSVIWIVLNGGASHLDTWDYKPELQKRNGEVLKNADPRVGFFKTSGKLLASPFRFARHGESGAWSSEILPETSRHVDDMAFVHSCYSRSNNHSPALFEMNTGMSRMGFPCVGSWLAYGLGTENENLPGFVVMTDARGRGLPKNHAQNWGSGFLPSVFQATRVKEKGAPIDDLQRPADVTAQRQRLLLEVANRLNRRHRQRFADQTQLEARIESLELAFRMQMAAPGVLSVDDEPAHVSSLCTACNIRLPSSSAANA